MFDILSLKTQEIISEHEDISVDVHFSGAVRKEICGACYSTVYSSRYEREIKTWGAVLYSLVDFMGVAKEK